MYVDSAESAKKFASSLRKKSRSFVGVEVWLAPAFPFIAPVALALKGSTIKVGAQALSAYADAPHTGEVSARMLKGLGVSFVIIGHSERRALGEDDESIRAQLVQAGEAKLAAILCVGEHERVADGSHFQEVANQLSRALHGMTIPAGRLMVAYEPVWAIGKSAAEAMQGEEVEEMAIFIRKILSEALGREAANKVPILYGGSVEAANAQALIKEGGVSGLLVGHASADVDSFIAILSSCKK
ncbi:MAG: Triose-phosphate isomerase [Candidatus Adlerbacteria bacterium]|nr:Triose-phosphate isomerase [Candidatus Adlerbacteria bacterium]